MTKTRDMSSGFSLMESVIATAIIGIFFVSAVSVFNVIGKAIMTARTRTVATNLAQEKIESLKNADYSRLRVTTAADHASHGYDNTFYPPEKGILVGDISYDRRILVQRIRENTLGKLEEVLPEAGDTGIKKITVTVTWTQGGKLRMFSLSNVREDKDRRPLDGSISGTVQEQGTMAPVAGAKVAVVNNLNWNTLTDSSGNYTLKVPTGTYKVNVTKHGYWPYTSPDLTVTSTPFDNDVSLGKMATGTVKGFVFINNHPLISRVVSSSVSVTGDDHEWVELYNPMISSLMMSATAFSMSYVDEVNISHPVPLTFVSAEIPSHGYFLIANTSTIIANNTQVAADAVYAGAPLQDIIQTGKKGGVVIEAAGVPADRVAWGPGPGSAPSEGVEGTGISSVLEQGKTHVRLTTHNLLSLTHGNAFDSDNNSGNFWPNMGMPVYICPHSTTTVQSPASGYPAFGAIISCGDGVSSPTTSYIDPAGTSLAYFALPNIATGTWTVSITCSSGSYSAYQEVGNVPVVSNGQEVWITSSATTPQWPYSGYHHVLLSNPPVWGYASGKVVSGGAGTGSIKVKSGGNWTFTSSNGFYTLPLLDGTYMITANPDNEAAGYISNFVENVPITAGTVTSVADISISAGGSVAGRVLSNSGDFLPNVTVKAYDFNGDEAGSEAVTQEDGTFLISNLRVSGNNFTVKPLLDASESSTPPQRVFTVAAGVTKWTDASNVFSSFTVVGAYGTITGNVKFNGAPIETGVLVIASTSTIDAAAGPPDISDTFRGSGTLYYGTVSHSDGSYSVQVRGGNTYNIYAWYTIMDRSGAIQTTPKYSLNNSVAAAGYKAVDLSWP